MNTRSLRNRLSKLISGQVLWKNEILDYYSVDSSSYQIKPKVVVIPRNSSDVKKVVKFASSNKIPITARGAGTGLVGSAIGIGIILDLKNFNKIKVLKDSILVGPGVLKGNIDQALKKHKKFFPVNPSIGPYCAVGGMIGANASGTRTIKYGAIIDGLLEVTLVDGRGELITLPKNSKIGNEVFSIAKTIDKTKYPNVTKNSCGYRLDSVSDVKKSHKVIAGSEGTLGIILSAKLRTFKIPPTRCLIVLGYDSVLNAIKDCQSIVMLKPSALEFVDKPTLGNIDYKFSSKTKCLLFVEFDSKLKTKITKIKKNNRGKIISELKKDNEIEKWWKYRDSALSYSLRSISKNEKAPHVIEDGTVPIEKLSDMISLIQKVGHFSKSRVIIYGHAGNGNLHVRLISKNINKKFVEKIARFYFSEIIKLGGTITGEHGDGQARSEFVKFQYEKNIYLAFKKLKKLFDPKAILNPDKILTNKSTITKNLVLN